MIDLKSGAYQEASQNLANAVMDENATQDQVSEGIAGLATAIQQEVSEQYRNADGDRRVLAERGFHAQTSAEEAYFRKFADAATHSRTYQDFVSTMDDANLPQTVIDEVMSQVQRQHPLLGAINARAVNRITKMYFNAGTAQAAIWGELDSEITQEIEGGFKEIDATQNKLSAFAQISRDELQLGPSYLQQLIVATLAESISNGLEQAVVSGNGINSPIGLDRDIHTGVTVSTTDGYPQKTAKPLASFKREVFNPILAELVVDENENEKAVNVNPAGGVTTPALGFACNTSTYLTKVDPAIHFLGANANDTLLEPARALSFYNSAYVPSDKAILFIPSEYYLLVAGQRGLEMSDEFKFLDDKRVFKQVMYGAGRAKDNTSAVYLDITDLKPAEIAVAGIASA